MPHPRLLTAITTALLLTHLVLPTTTALPILAAPVQPNLVRDTPRATNSKSLLHITAANTPVTTSGPVKRSNAVRDSDGHGYADENTKREIEVDGGITTKEKDKEIQEEVDKVKANAKPRKKQKQTKRPRTRVN